VATAQTPQTPPRARQASVSPAHPAPAVQNAPADPEPDPVLADAHSGRRPYLKVAFANPYNLSLLTGGLVASALTLNPIPAILTLGCEALWLLHAPESPRLRYLWWDPYFDRLRQDALARQRAERMAELGDPARSRVATLIARQGEIRGLAAQNPTFARDLLRSELGKTDRLVGAFLDMSLTCQRYEQYLNDFDGERIERDRKKYARIVQDGPTNGPEVQIAQKNLAVTQKRIANLDEIKHYLDVARGQLDLIENSFQLIAERIVTMQSPQELSGQLDELLGGVESIREATRDTELLLGPNDNV
jgi:hypothetical protein